MERVINWIDDKGEVFVFVVRWFCCFTLSIKLLRAKTVSCVLFFLEIRRCYVQILNLLIAKTGKKRKI